MTGQLRAYYVEGMEADISTFQGGKILVV